MAPKLKAGQLLLMASLEDKEGVGSWRGRGWGWLVQEGSEVALQYRAGPSGSGKPPSGHPAGDAQGESEKHLKPGMGGHPGLTPRKVRLAPRTLPGPHAEWGSPSPWVGLSHQIWVLPNKSGSS